MPNNMSLSEMRRQAYFLADETVSDVFPADRVNALINAGLARVARLTGVPRITATTPVYAAQAGYQLDSPNTVEDAPVVYSVKLDGTTLPAVPYTEDNAVGLPAGYFFVESELRLWPVPSADGVLEVTYEPEFTFLSFDAQETTLPYEAQELACIYAAALMKEKDDEYNAADRLLAQFNAGLRDLQGPRPGIYKAV